MQHDGPHDLVAVRALQDAGYLTGIQFHYAGDVGTWPVGETNCRATLWMTTWTPKGVTVGDDGRPGLDLWQEESVASPA